MRARSEGSAAAGTAAQSVPSCGTLYGVGVGPGDPELMTVKAVNVLAKVDVVAYFAKAGNHSHALGVAEQHLSPGVERLALYYPVTTEIHRHDPRYQALLADFYADCVARLVPHLNAGRSVAVIAEGDPLFFGSYMHLHTRLAGRYPTEVVPGISAMSASWSAAQLPICQGDDSVTVIPGTLDSERLRERIEGCDALVIMKIGRHLGRVREVLAQCGKLERALYIERVAQPQCRIMPLAQQHDDHAPYFSLILVPGWHELGFDSPLFHASTEPSS
ncbi:precorrin-2 C(20)-methyltransferase [Carnimonas bestiolae]|uniref:precorrin-2 C(20)-methyltransferase n=1 Tax=Carnimonas bestiolae TaxID=3402172 RepID=UPI003EDC547A